MRNKYHQTHLLLVSKDLLEYFYEYKFLVLTYDPNGGIFLELGTQNTSPSNVDSDKKILLSPKMYRLALVSLGLGTILFLSACAYSIYSLLTYRNNQADINDMQQSTQLQQEQLLILSKKAASLSEELHNLTRMETELRIQAGVKPPADVEAQNAGVDASAVNTDNQNEGTQPAATESGESNEVPTGTPDGQGGPIGELSITDVKEALDVLENNLKTRHDSLDELQATLKSQREQMAVMISMQAASQAANSAAAAISASGLMSTNSFAFGTSTAGSNVPSIWPTVGVVTSPYGLRWGGSDFHPGIDIANDMGTPILATADGIVEYAGWNSGGYGNMVDINHGNGIMTRYGHASQVVVSAGQHVTRGQIIALMGSTGFSTGPHVHYEVHVNGQRVNPISYL